MRVELILRVIGVASRLAPPGPSNAARPSCTASVTCVRAKPNHLPGPEVITAGTGRKSWFAGESHRWPPDRPARAACLGAERRPLLLCSNTLSAVTGAMVRMRGSVAVCPPLRSRSPSLCGKWRLELAPFTVGGDCLEGVLNAASTLCAGHPASLFDTSSPCACEGALGGRSA